MASETPGRSQLEHREIEAAPSDSAASPQLEASAGAFAPKEHLQGDVSSSLASGMGTESQQAAGSTLGLVVALASPSSDSAAEDIDTASATAEELIAALEAGDVSAAERMLAVPSLDPSGCDQRALCVVCRDGRLQMVERLLGDSRVDPAAKDNFAIRAASQNGHELVVARLLSDARVDPAACSDDALRRACKAGHVSVVKQLLADPRVDPSVGNNKPLRLAAYYGHASTVGCLLADPRVDANAHEATGEADSDTALQLAAAHGHADVVAVLLSDSLVDPTIGADNEASALDVAARAGHAGVVKLLLDDGRTDTSAFNMAPAAGHALASGRWEMGRVILASNAQSLSATNLTQLLLLTAAFMAVERLSEQPELDAFMSYWLKTMLLGRLCRRLLRSSRMEIYIPSETTAMQRMRAIAARCGISIVAVDESAAAARLLVSVEGRRFGISIVAVDEPAAAARLLASVGRWQHLDKRVDAAFVGEADARFRAVRALQSHWQTVQSLELAGARTGAILAQAHVRAVSIARELGRAMQPAIVQQLASRYRSASWASKALGLCSLLAQDETSGYRLAVAAAVPGGAVFAAEFDAARRGFALMRTAGVSRWSSLRTFSRMPMSIAMTLAPLAAQYVREAVAAGDDDEPTVTVSSGSSLSDDAPSPSPSSTVTSPTAAASAAAVHSYAANPGGSRRASAVKQASSSLEAPSPPAGEQEDARPQLANEAQPQARDKDRPDDSTSFLAYVGEQVRRSASWQHMQEQHSQLLQRFPSLHAVTLQLPSQLGVGSYIAAGLATLQAGRFITSLSSSSRALGCFSSSEATALQQLTQMAEANAIEVMHSSSRNVASLKRVLGRGYVDAALVARGSALSEAVAHWQTPGGRTSALAASSWATASHVIIAPTGARAAAVARELARGLNQSVLQTTATSGLRWVMRGAGALGLAAAASRDEPSGLRWSAAASVLAAPVMCADLRAAAGGFRLMRQAGVGTLASLRCWASLPFSVGMAAAPLLGHLAKQQVGGYANSDQSERGSCVPL